MAYGSDRKDRIPPCTCDPLMADGHYNPGCIVHDEYAYRRHMIEKTSVLKGMLASTFTLISINSEIMKYLTHLIPKDKIKQLDKEIDEVVQKMRAKGYDPV